MSDNEPVEPISASNQPTVVAPKASTASSADTTLQAKNCFRRRRHLFGRKCCGVNDGGSLRRTRSEDINSTGEQQKEERFVEYLNFKKSVKLIYKIFYP